MREMGEGMLRIFARMRDQDLVPPEIKSDLHAFEITLHHRSVFSPKDQEWLNSYSQYGLSRDEQKVVLLGRNGNLLSTNDIMKALAIGDVDEFRKLVERLRRKGIVYNAAGNRRAGIKSRTDRRWSVRPPDQAEQYRSELIQVLRERGAGALDPTALRQVVGKLSPASPYKEKPQESLKLLGLVDERLRPLPVLIALWGSSMAAETKHSPKLRVEDISSGQHTSVGKVRALKTNGYGFIETDDGSVHFFHISDLLDRDDWDRFRIGSVVQFVGGEDPKGPTAKQVQPFVV
jgi:cold shock CspA family protein